MEIPVIDVSIQGQATADKLIAAAAQHGFVFIKASRLEFTAEDIDGAFNLASRFFASSQEEKQAFKMQPNNRGWTCMGSEILDPATQKEGDPKEAFNFGEFVNGRAQQPLPPVFAAHEAQLSRFSDLCYGLCLRILSLFAIGLKIDPSEGGAEWFSSRHDPAKGPSGTILRLLHYPPSATARTSASPSIRAGAHSDYGSLTLLFRLPSQPGLEILTPSGTWSAVPVQPECTASDPFPPILVNIGDLLSYWTGGLLKSTVHRVVSAEGDGAGEERYSIAFFCHPCRDTQLVPVPSELVRARTRAEGERGQVGYGSGANAAAGAVGAGRAITAQEHLQGRLAATYGWGS